MRIMTRFGVPFAHFTAEETRNDQFSPEVEGCEAVICGPIANYMKYPQKKGEPSFALYFKDGKWRLYKKQFHEGYEWEHLSKAIAVCLSMHKMEALP